MSKSTIPVIIRKSDLYKYRYNNYCQTHQSYILQSLPSVNVLNVIGRIISLELKRQAPLILLCLCSIKNDFFSQNQNLIKSIAFLPSRYYILHLRPEIEPLPLRNEHFLPNQRHWITCRLAAAVLQASGASATGLRGHATQNYGDRSMWFVLLYHNCHDYPIHPSSMDKLFHFSLTILESAFTLFCI
jgi:hypothetical protein